MLCNRIGKVQWQPLREVLVITIASQAMALPLGKLPILVGAGIVGSVLAKEGRIPDVSNFVSGALKVVFKQLSCKDYTPTVEKPHNDALMDQINNLLQELQLLARDRTIAIVNASGTGLGKYVTVIVVVVGDGYIWWKGLSDACTSIGNRLGKLHESIEEAKEKLSAGMNRLDSSLDECAALSENTREEECKIKEIEWKQVSTIEGVNKLCRIALSLENSKATDRIQASPSSPSKLTIELPPATLSFGATQTESLPPTPTLSTDPPPPLYSSGSYQESSRISEVINLSSTHVDSNNISPSDDKTNGYSSGLLGLRFSGLYAPFVTRTRSATDALVQHARSRS